jgi:hypothetical protein
LEVKVKPSELTVVLGLGTGGVGKWNWNEMSWRGQLNDLGDGNDDILKNLW